MTHETAIQKARTADLQKELGVRIDSSRFMTAASVRRCQFPNLRKAEDSQLPVPVLNLCDPNAVEHANAYLASLFSVTRERLHEENVSVLYAAELKWVELPGEGNGSYGTYVLHLVAPLP